MGPISRRSFLRITGATAAGLLVARSARLPRAFADVTADNATTLDATIVRGALAGSGSRGNYYRLAWGPGEPYVVRTELAARGATPVRRSLLHFVHLTDVHLVDAQSPARVEFLDRLNEPGNGCDQHMPFDAAFRAHETLTLHVFEAMIRRIRAVERSPVTGAPISFAMSTGDNADNEQHNEIRWFIDVLDGNTVLPNSGGSQGYEGVQSAQWADQEYWHPDGGVADKYKRQWGFPESPGMLQYAMQPFGARGIGMPWYQTLGNHDGLLQGNAPRNPAFAQIAVGPLKVTTLTGVDPCDSFEIVTNDPAALLTMPARVVTANADRRIISRAEYVREFFDGTPQPGHGFTQQNLADGTAYYVNDDWPGVRLISLDTVNPGGYNDGSIGAAQLAWLEARLTEVHSRYIDANGDEATAPNTDRLVILFSHHGLRSLTNPLIAPNTDDPGSNDLPRKMASDVEPLVHRFPNVIAWVNGHTHRNVVSPKPDPAGKTNGFWDIGTAAHVDWPPQARLVEVVDNGDATLSIFCTMIDHAGDAAPDTPIPGHDNVAPLASMARELMSNDPQKGIATGTGHAEDRNVELVIAKPF